MDEFPPRFDFNREEVEIYRLWLESGGFAPQNTTPEPESSLQGGSLAQQTTGGGAVDTQPSEARSILMPPPNANAPIHIGHAYEVAIQDAFIRYWRLRGYNTLWQPGADHAGFETQVVFEKKLEKEGRSWFNLDRDALYDEIFAFSKYNQGVIRGQFERLGASCDWRRFVFTLDAPIVKKVYTTFKMLFDDDLVYRAKRPVNWCVKHQTTLSDLETRYEEREDTLYYLTYGPFTIATARPETKFGDKYVVMHPDDARYADYRDGQSLIVEWLGGPVTATVVKDSAIDMGFGTGVMTITPWHDPVDFAIAQRHGLDGEQIIGFDGRLLPIAGEFAGAKLSESRPKIVQKLADKGLLVKTDPHYRHSVQVCYKCGSVIEPHVMDQWWLALTKTDRSGRCLCDLAVAAVRSGETKFVAKRFENQFTSWMRELKDWPLSRQIVWGIRLPVWYCDRNRESGANQRENQAGLMTRPPQPDPDACPPIVTEGEIPAACPTCGCPSLTRDPDVFDTWFSSCQWPFLTLGSHPGDLETFYPTTLMAPGYDILFFWVARMMMLSIYLTGQSPYRTVLLHGLIRDRDRQKMSKSKGNVVDPLAVAGEYGADAIRLALLYGAAPGSDPVISTEKIAGMRNFCTKMWNIARFVAQNSEPTTKAEFIAVTDADHAVAKKRRAVVQQVTAALDAYQFHLALEALYDFVWHDVADAYVEAAKGQLNRPATKSTTQSNLLAVLVDTLRLLHPFAPFVTEAVWRRLSLFNSCLMNDHWPDMGEK